MSADTPIMPVIRVDAIIFRGGGENSVTVALSLIANCLGLKQLCEGHSEQAIVLGVTRRHEFVTLLSLVDSRKARAHDVVRPADKSRAGEGKKPATAWTSLHWPVDSFSIAADL
jgi:hypothetical protein